MTPTVPEAGLDDITRSEALFASDLSMFDDPDPETAGKAIRDAISRHGTRGCATLMAHEFGEHPETAAPRMRWARATVATIPAVSVRSPQFEEEAR